jgi:hypothetical protein
LILNMPRLAKEEIFPHQISLVTSTKHIAPSDKRQASKFYYRFDCIAPA